MRWIIGILGLLIGTPVWAGIYCGIEPIAPLPTQMRGFLLDHRLLRALTLPPQSGLPESLLKQTYRQTLRQLLDLGATRPLTATELADVTALQLRLGEASAVVARLAPLSRQFADDHRIQSHLALAWFLQGDLARAIPLQQLAWELSPQEFREAERALLRLMQSRARNPKSDGLDPILTLPATPSDADLTAAVATLQRVALWLPADGRVLWQLGERVFQLGDLRTAVAILDGCVGEFALGNPELRRNRTKWREELDRIEADPMGHLQARTRLAAKSNRPLLRRFDPAILPKIQPTGITPLPWPILGETSMGNRFPPRYPDYVTRLNGRRVQLTGFIQPVGDDPNGGTVILLEFPIGCWFCETPDFTGMIAVKLPPDRKITPRQAVQIEGKFRLNFENPEDYLFELDEVRIGAIE
ncbi:tetratricopeptide repeat protein [Tuwongella immobilis]|uniref:DUF3299 domain-containing protein n=1 Tax=Tuwongella immobilis TaxID=692036 RepID=A0A6C2YMP7_9BACT|nr:hypothetical protein [Tuwongella immobilis]VIP02868.1 hypothetical protein : [Tuwongella immobilis]VTS02692.1 hypothetical protein : [Tuwongella immobilis]